MAPRPRGAILIFYSTPSTATPLLADAALSSLRAASRAFSAKKFNLSTTSALIVPFGYTPLALRFPAGTPVRSAIPSSTVDTG